MVLAEKVKGLVEEYVDFSEKDFSATQLTYTWVNVKFKSDLLQKFDVTSDFPIYVKDSTIGKIFVSISYSLYITIEINDVLLLCVPNSKEQNAKQMDTYCDNLLYKLQQSDSWGAYFKSGLANYLTQGLKIVLRNVHIRYAEVEPAACCVEATIGFLDVNYSKQKTNVVLDSSNLFIHTKIKAEDRWEDVKLWQKKKNEERRRITEGVLSDVSVHLSMSEIGGTEATELEFSLRPPASLTAPSSRSPPLIVRFRADQLSALVAIQDTWRFLRVREVHWKHRPPSDVRPVKGKCHLWWRYAFEVVRETKLFPYKFEKIKRYRRFYAEYIEAFKVLNSQKDKARTAEALTKLRQLSRVLNRTSIVLAREEALTQMLDEDSGIKRESLSDEDFDETKDQVGDLKVKTSLPIIQLCLYEKKFPQLRCVMEHLAVDYMSKPLQASTTLSVSLGSAAIEFNQSAEEEPSWLQVMAPSAPAEKLLQFSFESLLTEPGSQRVEMHLRRTRAFVYQPVVACLLKALSEVSSASSSTGIAKASLAYTGQLVSAVLPSRSRLSWDLNVHNPELILPEWGSSGKDGAVIYCNLGHLKSTLNAQKKPQMSSEIINVNYARLKGIKIAFADSNAALEVTLKEKNEGLILRPTNIDVQLLNLTSGRQRVELDVETLHLNVQRLTDFFRVLVHASFLGGPPMVRRDWALQRRLEVELREVLACPGTTLTDLRDLALRVSQSRPKRRQSSRLGPGRLAGFDLASFRRRRKEGRTGPVFAATVENAVSPDANRPTSTSRAIVATELDDLQTERNRMCWEMMLRVRQWRADVEVGGRLSLSGTEIRLECGKLQYGLAGMFEAKTMACSWSSQGKTVNFLSERRKPDDAPLCQLTFIDLQPNCPRFDVDYGSVRTTVAMRLGTLELNVVQSAIVDFLRSAAALYEQLHVYITEVPTSVDLLTKEISNAITDLIRRNDVLEQKKINRKGRIIRFHTDTRIKELILQLTDTSDFVLADLTDIRFEARVERTCGRYTCCLHDCFVKNLRKETLYKMLLHRSRLSDDSAVDDLVYAAVRRQLKNKESNTWSTHAEFLMNRVDIVCLSDFVGEVHRFAAPFANAVTALSAAVSQRALTEIERMTSSQSRLNLKLHMPSPRFLLPIGSQAQDLFLLKMGDLRVATNTHGAEEEEAEAFKIKLDKVQFARSLFNGEDVLPCIDILFSDQLARVNLVRRPLAKELEVSATMFHIEPKITPKDYRMLLEVLDAWKTKEGRQDFVDNVTVVRQSSVIQTVEEPWTYCIKAELEGFDLFINDCVPPPRGRPLSEKDLLPFGLLNISKLSLQLDVDSLANTTISAEWEGLVLRDTREIPEGPVEELISISNKKVELLYRVQNSANFVNLRLADVSIYADFVYFRTLLSLFETTSARKKSERDEREEEPEANDDEESAEWKGSDWTLEVTGAELNVHCLSEVTGKSGIVDKRFLDILLNVHDERSDERRPWKFYVGKKGRKMEMAFVTTIDFGYVDSLFCHVLDTTHVILKYKMKPDSFESNIQSYQETVELTVKSCDHSNDPHIGLNLSPLLVFHVRKIVNDVMSPIERFDRESIASSSSILRSTLRKFRRRRLQSLCDVTDSALAAVDRDASEVFSETFALKDADENQYIISPEKLPAVKNMPAIPCVGDQEMMIEVDPIRLRLHMNVNDPILRLDLALEEFVVKNWRSQIAMEIKNLQVALWSFNDKEQEWEALVEKIAKEEYGKPFEATNDAFYMWSCSVLLYQQPSRVLGDQVLEELMTDMTYHAITRRASGRKRQAAKHYLPTAVPDIHFETSSIESDTSIIASHDGSVDDLARALEEEMCYFLVINPVARFKRNRQSRDPLLINLSPNTLKRTTEITQCLLSLLDPEQELPDKRLVPTLRIVNDSRFGVEVNVDAKGQVLELERCVRHKCSRSSDDHHLSLSGMGPHTYKLSIKVKGFQSVSCRVGRHSRLSVLTLRPEMEANSSFDPALDDHILVQTTTDLALATVRLTSRYFIDNKLQLPLFVITREGAQSWEVAPRTAMPLPLGTSRHVQLVVQSKGYEPISCDFHQETSGEIREMVSSEDKGPSYFLKLSVSKEIMHNLVVEASIRINNHLPYAVQVGFPDTKHESITIPRNHHIYLPMFSGDERLSLTVTVLYYQRHNWRTSYVMKPTASKAARRLVLEEVPGPELASGFRTGRRIAIAARRSEEHECRTLHLFAPLWIVNDKTDLNMLIKEDDADIVRVPPSEEPALLTPRHVGSSTHWHHCKIRICVVTPELDDGMASQRWSAAMDVGAVTKTVAMTVPKVQKVRGGGNGTDGWMVLAKIEQLGHLCSRTLTVLPRYILQNRSRKALFLTEDGVTDAEYELQPGVTKPFWPRGTQLTAHVRTSKFGEPSKSFAYNIVQSTAIRLDLSTAVTVDVSGGVDLTPVSIRFKRFRKGDAPLRVENLCRDRTIWLHQKGKTSPDVEVPPHKYIVYFWDNPAVKRDIFCVAKGGCDPACECQKKFQIGINANQAGEIRCPKSKVFWISFIHENQRTLLITHKEHLFRSVKSLSQAEPLHLWFQLRVEEVGISLVSGQREIAFLSISGFSHPKKLSSRNYPGFFLMYQCSARNRLMHIRVAQLRLFNCLRDPVFREVIYDRPDEQQPFLDFGMKWRVASTTCAQALDTLRIKLCTIIANLDFGFVMSVYSAFFAAETSSQTPEAGAEGVEPRFKLQTLKDVVKHTDTDHADEYLVRNAVMESFKLRISLSGDGKVHGAYDRSVQVVDILAPLVGSIFRSKDTQLTVSALTRCGVTMPLRQLGNDILAHCKSELMRKVYILLLGVDILGDPLTLFYTVSEGFRDVDDEKEEGVLSMQELMRNEEREEEIETEGTEFVVQEIRFRRRPHRGHRRTGVRARVIASLARRTRRTTRVGRHLCGGVANSLARVTCALGHIVSKATFDPSFIQERRERFHRAVDPSDCGREACISLVKGIGAGAFGIVYRPIKGGRKAGFGGAVRGLGRGVVGVPTRPSVGILDFISLNADAIKKLALHDQIPFPIGRRPRAWVTKTFSYYSDWEAKGQAILFSLDEGYYYEKNYSYIAHVYLGSKRTKAIFVTNKSLIKTNKFLNYKWRTCWEIKNEFIKRVDERMGSNPKANNESQLGIFLHYEKNPGNGREKVIFLNNDYDKDYLRRAIRKVTDEAGDHKRTVSIRA